MEGTFFSHAKIIPALTGLNFDIEAGQVVGLISPSSGEIKRNISKDQTGVIFGHKCSLWWDLPVQYSFDNFAALYKLDKKTYKKRLEYLVNSLKIGHILDRDVRRLSLGERIKSELVSTLLHSPKFIF